MTEYPGLPVGVFFSGKILDALVFLAVHGDALADSVGWGEAEHGEPGDERGRTRASSREHGSRPSAQVRASLVNRWRARSVGTVRT